MDARDRAKGNGVSLSVGPLCINLMADTNWGVPTGPMFVVTLDPQLKAESPAPESAVERGVEFVGRRGRRRLIGELANEFALIHDDLLRDLAR